VQPGECAAKKAYALDPALRSRHRALLLVRSS